MPDGTGTPVQLTKEVAPSFAQMPVWSPDGRYIAFMSFREGYCSVFRMTAEGNDQVNLTPKDLADPANRWCGRTPLGRPMVGKSSLCLSGQVPLA